MWTKEKIKAWAQQWLDDKRMKDFLVGWINKIASTNDKQKQAQLKTELYRLVRDKFIEPFEMRIAEKVHWNWETNKFNIGHTHTELTLIKGIKEKCETLPYFYKELINLARQQTNTVANEPIIEEVLFDEENLQARQQKNTVANEPIIEEVLFDEENLEHSTLKKTKIEEVLSDEENLQARQQKNTVANEPIIEEVLSDEENLEHSTLKKTLIEKISFETNNTMNELVKQKQDEIDKFTPSTSFKQPKNIYPSSSSLKPPKSKHPLYTPLKNTYPSSSSLYQPIDKFTPSTSFNSPIHKFTPSTSFNPPTEKAKNQQQENIITKGLIIEELFSNEEIPFDTSITMNESLIWTQDQKDSIRSEHSHSGIAATSFSLFNQENEIQKTTQNYHVYESSINIKPEQQPPTTTEMNWDLYEKSKDIPHTVATTSNTTFVETKVTSSSTHTNEQVTQQEINNTVIQNETTSQPSTSSTQKTAHFHP